MKKKIVLPEPTAKANKGAVLSQCCNANAITLLDENQKANWACEKCKKFFETRPMFSRTATVHALITELEEGVLTGIYGTKNKVKLLLKLYNIKKQLS